MNVEIVNVLRFNWRGKSVNCQNMRSVQKGKKKL